MSEANERELEKEGEVKPQNGAAASEQGDELNGHAQENVEPLESAKSDEADESQEASKGEGTDYKQKYFYLAAEMDNMRKRFEREKQNLLKFGNEKVLSDLVEVIDNLDRTLDALEGESDKKVKNIVVGVDMVRKQFLEALKDNGLERIEALGEKFDPNYHEAMAQQPSEDQEDETVINEYQKGYVLNGRLLRPAKVIVAKNEKN